MLISRLRDITPSRARGTRHTIDLAALEHDLIANAGHVNCCSEVCVVRAIKLQNSFFRVGIDLVLPCFPTPETDR